MQALSRRAVLGIGGSGLALVGRSGRVFATTATKNAETLTVGAGEGSVTLQHYAAYGPAKRPCVVLLHGSAGFDLRLRAYRRYVDALNADGIDAYLLHYYSRADDTALKTIALPKGRTAYRAGQFDVWSEWVSSALTAILARPDCSGRLGLLGFSLGGYVASETAARDPRVSALAVMYGAMPDKMLPQVTHLPPMIALHGDADHNVPLSKGEQLVRLAKAVGASADLVVYPGKAHGFDFSDTDPATANAIKRVTEFFKAKLKAG